MTEDRQQEREPRPDYWREAHGGFRGSHMLAGGAGLLGVAATLALAAQAGSGTGSGLQMAGWLVYVLGLGVVGLAFAWTCIPGILPRAGLATAVLHVAQGTYLLVILYGHSTVFLPPVALTAGRQLALVVLAAAAAAKLGQAATLSLGAAAGLGLGKTCLRSLAPLYDGGVAVDVALLLLLAAALFVTARRLRRLEDEWAREHHPGGRSDFSEFNNPQHDWNRPGNSSGSACTGATR
jgi:hypothetical protein